MEERKNQWKKMLREREDLERERERLCVDVYGFGDEEMGGLNRGKEMET